MRTTVKKIIGATLMCAIGAVIILIPDAAFAVRSGGLQSVATLRCLDSNSGGSAYTLTCNSGNFQGWTWAWVDSDSLRMIDWATGLCLDSNAAGSVYTLACNGGNFQRWYATWTSNGGGSFEMRNYATLRCLDGDASGRVYTLDCNGGNFQRWYRG